MLIVIIGEAVPDAELFVGLYCPCGDESDRLCGRIDGIRNVRSVGVVEEQTYERMNEQLDREIMAERTKTEGECHSPVLPSK